VDLRTTADQNTGVFGLDSLTSIEEVSTGDGADTLIGNDAAYDFDSGNGRDDLTLADHRAGVRPPLRPRRGRALRGRGPASRALARHRAGHRAPAPVSAQVVLAVYQLTMTAEVERESPKIVERLTTGRGR